MTRISDDAEYVATIVPAISEIGRENWTRLANPQQLDKPNPFISFDFLSALEESECASGLTGWQPQHIFITSDDAAVAAMPLYLKSHSQGEYVFDYGWADAFEQAGGRYYPKLQCSVPFTPATAPKFLTCTSQPDEKKLLINVAQQLAAQNNISSIHATFLAEDELELTQEAEWLTRFDTQFHWENQQFGNFDEFLQTLSSRKRKAIRKERQAVRDAGIKIVWKTGDDISESDWDHFFEFYQDTGNRKWGQPYLNRTFFSLFSDNLKRQTVLMLAMLDGEPIAGTLNFEGDSTLFGRYWGCTLHVPFLHFELCYYQAIDYAIAHKLTRVEAGAQGEHKLARGYAPTTTRSAHWIGHTGLRNAISDYLENERKAVLRNQTFLDAHTPFKKG